MATESTFVAIARNLIEHEFKGQQLTVKHGAVLLYQVTVDNNLNVMTQEQVRNPKRGDSAFQTDICLFEKKSDEVLLPRVVLEFKTTITTHDVLTYSAKAAKHKQIYPYLRYGLVAESERKVPSRFFTHNEALDFCLALKGLTDDQSAAAFCQLVMAELECSQLLEKVAFDESGARLYRTKIMLEDVV